MVDVEKMAAIAMQIVTYARTAKSCYILALEAAKKRDYEKSESHLKTGDESFLLAHSFHLELLKEEAATKEPQVSLLLMHAEDQLMNTETLKFVILEFIEMLKDKENANHGI